MSAIKEKWEYGDNGRVWVGKYLNSQNMLHWHDDCELIYVERGALTVTVNGTNYRVNDGNAVFIDSRVLHRISATDPTSLVQTIIFDNSIISGITGNAVLSSPLLCCGESVKAAYAELLKELKDKPFLYVFSTTATVQKLIIEIFRSFPTEQKKPSGNTDKKLKALFTEIKKNYDWYTLGDAAEFMNMNASYLSRLFAAKTGMHFISYVNCVRVEEAVNLISEGSLNMTEIATRCGFGTIRNFNSIFKKLTGYSPSGLPAGYTFTAAVAETDIHSDPTLASCTLIESSN